jgi:hypothetical protein
MYPHDDAFFRHHDGKKRHHADEICIEFRSPFSLCEKKHGEKVF